MQLAAAPGGTPDATFWAPYAWIDPVVEREVLITVADGRITAVAADSGPAPAGAVRLTGLTLPGMAKIGRAHV